IPVGNLYRDVIDSTKVINIQIRKNPSFDLVLGQDWLRMCKAKISFGFSSKTCSHYAKIVIDCMSIPLIEENSNKASSVKNDPHKSDLSLEELTNMLKNLSLR
ncbi:9463_t:CDS:2, partial [Gigaspora margarita]